jgi:hypothetical protein
MRWILLLPLAIACTRAEDNAPSSSSQQAVTSTTALAATRATSTGAATAVAAPSSVGFDTGAVPQVSAPLQFDAAGHPILPIILHNDCEGEDCEVSFPAIACLPTALRSAPAESARIVTAVAKGDTVQVVRRDLRVRAVGVVVVRRNFVLDRETDEGAEVTSLLPRSDTVRLTRDDTVFVLRYMLLDRWRWAYHGQLHDSQGFWTGPPDHEPGLKGSDSTLAVARSSPTTEDWWYVQPRTGVPGWWRGDGHEELWSISDMVRRHDDCPLPRSAPAPHQS